MRSPLRILVVGGYGNFGARICRALHRRGLEVIAAGRHPESGHRAAGFDSAIGQANLDVDDPRFAERLKALVPGIVIHCVGPFQGQDYRVAKTSLAAGAHYIDLADGRAFVCRFSSEIDPVARAAGLLAVTGASTLPAISSAVLDSLRDRFSAMEDIQISIAPAQRSPRGTATLRAVFSYLGRSFPWLEGGVWRQASGWQELRRMRFLGLGTRWAAACDVPDLELLPGRYPGVKTLQFRAALEVSVQHFALAAVAQLRRFRVPVPIDRYAAQLDYFASWLDRFGSTCGGMLVSVMGTGTDGHKHRLDWHLTADDNHGPEIPCMAAILLASKLARGEFATRGGVPCVDLLSLKEFELEFAHWGIETRLEEVPV